MAILRANEIRAMSREELIDRLRELRGELARTQTTLAAGGSLQNPSKIRELKRSIARILTIIREKERG